MGRQWKQKFWRYKEDDKFYIKHGSVCLELTQTHSDGNLILKSHVVADPHSVTLHEVHN